MKRIILSCMLLSVLSYTSAQTIGKVTDEQNHPLAFANIVVMSLPDSTFVTGTVSSEDGNFSLNTDIIDGLLKVSCIGYTTLYKELRQGESLVLKLKSESQQLGEVVVKGDLPKTRVKGDAMVTEVKNSKLSYAGTANDVLRKLPGVADVGNGLQ
ncbi:carboxypeptidase-like regulatory domain-containing protein, partial [uncultured Bacteroides sp.]